VDKPARTGQEKAVGLAEAAVESESPRMPLPPLQLRTQFG